MKRGFFLFCYPLFSLFSTEPYTLTHLYLTDLTSVHVLEIDPAFFNIISVTAEPGKLETVQELAEKYEAFAGINGGFFKQEGEFAEFPMGALKIGEEWITTPYKARGSIGWTNNGSHPLFDQILTKITGFKDKFSFPFDSLNHIPKEDETILYTSFVSKKHLVKRWEGTFEVEVIPQLIPLNAKQWKEVEYIVQGAPLLIQQGHLVDFSLEKISPSFLLKKHARTAVGVLPNGHFLFVVVDGTHNILFPNEGIIIADLAHLMQQLGCQDALNLDGGGSSTLVINNQVINQPSGYDSLRKVSDAVLIIAK